MQDVQIRQDDYDVDLREVKTEIGNLSRQTQENEVSSKERYDATMKLLQDIGAQNQLIVSRMNADQSRGPNAEQQVAPDVTPKAPRSTSVPSSSSSSGGSSRRSHKYTSRSPAESSLGSDCVSAEHGRNVEAPETEVEQMDWDENLDEVNPMPEPIGSSTENSSNRERTQVSRMDTMGSQASLPGPELTKFIVDTMSKTISQGLSSLVRTEAYKTKPSMYKRSQKDGGVDDWITLMRRHITRTKGQISNRDKAWFVLECIEGEARSYVISKPERDTDEP